MIHKELVTHSEVTPSQAKLAWKPIGKGSQVGKASPLKSGISKGDTFNVKVNEK